MDEAKYAQYFSKYEYSHVNITLVSSLKNQEFPPIKLSQFQSLIKTNKEKQFQQSQIFYHQYMENIYKQQYLQHQNIINANDKKFAHIAPAEIPISLKNDFKSSSPNFSFLKPQNLSAQNQSQQNESKINHQASIII